MLFLGDQTIRQELSKNFEGVIHKVITDGAKTNELSKTLHDEEQFFPKEGSPEDGLLSGGAPKITPYLVAGPAEIIDLAKPLATYAGMKNQTDALSTLQQVQMQAEMIVTEEDLLDRFSKYNLSVTDILGSQQAVAQIAEQVNQTKDDENTDGLISFFKRIKDKLKTAFDRLKFTLINIGRDISDKIDGVIQSLGRKLKENINTVLEKISDLLSSITSLFSSALVKLIDWASTIKKIATQKNFALKSVKISIEPAQMKMMSIAGFPLPTVEFKMPKIDFEFGGS